MSHRLLYDIVDIVYLLNGNCVKRENLFKRWLKNFAELKNVTLNAISIQHVADVALDLNNKAKTLYQAYKTVVHLE